MSFSNCLKCQRQFEITEEDQAFYEKISPVIGGKRYLMPAPILCPDCRQQRRLAFRNERKLYHRKCDFTGKQIISIYSPDKPYVVYNQKDWWSDAWEGLDYGREFDFGRPFFEQFDELWRKVPQLPLITSKNENSDYANFSESEKNCYLLFASNRNEDCYYSEYIWDSKNCMDCLMMEKGELCYMCVECINCFKVLFSQKCSDCHDVEYSFDCRSCHDLFACAGLRNKAFCILNEKYPEAEYHKITADAKKRAQILEKFEALKLKIPHLYADILHCEDVSGSWLHSCRRAYDCFNSFEIEDAKYVENVPGASRDIYDVSGCYGCELCMELTGVVRAYHSSFLAYCIAGTTKNSFYTVECVNGHNLFGCIGLKQKEYCILNKQYSPEEYEALLPRIISHMEKMGEWGQFFPIRISPFGYNETVAHEYFPMTIEEIKKHGWKCYEEEPSDHNYSGKKVVAPERIEDVDDSICVQILTCEVSGKSYKIIPQELAFYRQMNLPIPRKSPDQRYKERRLKRNPRTLWNRQCQQCGSVIKTTYATSRPEIVYCENCYLKAMY